GTRNGFLYCRVQLLRRTSEIPGQTALGPWMSLIIRAPQPLSSDMGVNLCGNEVGMPQQFLHAPQISAGAQHVRRITVPELVRRKRGIKPGNFEIALETKLHEPWVHGRKLFRMRGKHGQ